jgi:hypothetical protein
MSLIFTNDANNASPPDDFAFVAHFLCRCSYLHFRLLDLSVAILTGIIEEISDTALDIGRLGSPPSSLFDLF